MNKYHIHHCTNPSFEEVVKQPRKYAGIVEAESIEEAFELSQNIDKSWNIAHPCRSTSVGDVIQNGDKLFIVCNVGFKELKIIDLI
jgi:hypothetical protein